MESSVIIGGASSKNARNAADYYATPRDCTVALLRRFSWLFEGQSIWEPACGDGAISKVLEEHSFDVASTDLHDRGFGKPGIDFLKSNKSPFPIITNPPFKLAEQFIEHSASFGVPFAMLLKSTYWHAAKRFDLFNRTKPLAVLAMAWRPAMSPERGRAATMDFCWTVWDGKPTQNTRYIIEKRQALDA